jgi:hypothetical protein
MTRIKKGMTYFRLHEDIKNEDLIVIILIPEANKQIIIINIYFAHEGCKSKNTLSDLNLILLKFTANLRALI